MRYDGRHVHVKTNGLGIFCGIVAAALFGASAPVAKLLLPGFTPIGLAAVLYLGAAAALTPFRLWPGVGRRRIEREASLRSADVPALAAIVVAGGVAGPVLMLVGLQRVAGLAASLLLNLEAPFTMLLAVAAFREHLGRRESLGAGLIVLGAVLLAYGPGDLRVDPWGATAIATACAAWALDNNLTQRLSLRDPIALVHVKTLGSGTLCFVVAWLAGQSPTATYPTLIALGVGALSYGLSIVLDAYALRLLGAAREAALFATAPFAGALLAIPLLGERPTLLDLAAAATMIAGVVVLARQRHAHLHDHEPLEHDHSHVHDEHHRHAHDGLVTEPHAHPHRHERLVHDHPHVSDLHHRHPH